MGLIRSIYLDACIAIYLVEEHPVYAAIIERELAASNDDIFYRERRVIDFHVWGVQGCSPACTVYHTALVEMEALVLPLRQQSGCVDSQIPSFLYDKQAVAND